MAKFKFEYSSEGNIALVNINETELAQLVTEALLDADQVIDYDEIKDEMTNKAKAMGLEVND